jgi:hypothetical protein
MSILTKVYYSLLIDIKEMTGVHLDLPDNFEMSWVLIEGPALDKQVLQFLEGTRVNDPDFPEWLLPLWKAFRINNNTAGILKCLRTCLVFGYKAEFEPNEKQLIEAQSAFEEANLGVEAWSESFKRDSVPRPTFREARRLVRLVIRRADWFNLYPNHGPGAVFPSHSPWFKGRFDICTPIVEYYPYDQYFNMLPLLGHTDLTSHDYLEYDKIICKMVAVPKDSRGPRIICVHPKEAVWIQQGQRHVLERVINQHTLTAGRINFSDQKVNGKLALSSSKDQEFCTIDLKEASDRIANSLVEYLFGYSSKLLCSTRASHVLLLDGRLVDLHMFAPMGNALTFPVESLVFWSLVRAGILSRYGVNCDDIYVFGDDIIVPSRFYDGAIYGLVQAGLIPNFGKTFRKGLFRESCGVDAYNGEDVTPYRMKVRGINSYSDAESVCDLAKRLRMSGFSDTSSFLYSAVSRKYGRLSLTNDPDCQGLVEFCRYDFGDILRYEQRLRFNKDLHVWEVPYRKRSRTLEVRDDHDWYHVQDSLLSLIRKDKCIVVGSFPDSERSMGNLAIESERGLSYPTPRGERLIRGSSQIRLY